MRAAYQPEAVARYKFRKEIAREDLWRGAKLAGAAGAAGAAAGALAGGGSAKARAIRATIGGALGVAGVQGVRAATDKSRDGYGDRSRTAKAAEAT